MEPKTYAVTVYVTVNNEDELYQEVLGKLVDEGLDDDNIEDALRPNGEINACACLRMMIDPNQIDGCDILDSVVLEMKGGDDEG